MYINIAGDITENDARYPLKNTYVYPGCTLPNEIDCSHYGLSLLRAQAILAANDSNLFSMAQQELMNATTVTTTDTRNKDSAGKNLTYTTTDKLYAPATDKIGCTYIKVGSNNQVVIDIESFKKYYDSTFQYWTRTAYDGNSVYIFPEVSLTKTHVTLCSDIKNFLPVSNLNLSNLLFASSAKAATSNTESGAVSGTIAADTALTLRLDGKDKKIGAAYCDAEDGVIVADKAAAATGTVSLVVQGNDGTNDWYYSVPVEGRTVVKADEIKSKCSLSTAPNLADCHIWLEITDTDGMVYANSAKAKDISLIDNVAVTGVKPVGGMAFTTASCTTTGIAITTAKITYTTKENENDVAVTDKLAAWDKTYKATFSLATGIENDVVYAFTDHVSVNIDGEGTDNTISPNADGTLTVTKEFTTLKRKIVSVTAPAVPADNTFTTYYGFDGNADSPLSTSESVSSNELGNQATVTLEGTESVQSVTEKMNVTWTVANEDGARYNKTPGAANTFRWTISKDDFTKYDASTCTGYDAQTGNLTDTIAINNKAAIPVTITGTDSSENYTGVTIDVSRYFTLDVHAGTPTYSIITGTDGGTGVGTLSGSVLTVTKTGTFKIKVNTAANGIYGAGEKIITITVANGTIAYSVTDYSGTYDGQSHSISVNVTNPEGTIISYSTDGENYGSDNPSFTKAGNYTVYYRITKDNYNTISNNSAVNVAKAASAPNKPDNTMNVDYNKKKVSDITTLSEGWAWQDADKDTALTVGTVVKATAVYTGVDKGNYAVESVEISITRAECTHATTEVKNAKDATCTEKGYTGDTCCTVCGKVITAGADINDLGHDMTKTVSAEVKATCTTDGKEAVKGCSRCDHTEGGATIDALGHKWDAGKVTKKPTETAEGVKTYTCRACGNTKKKAIPKKAATTPKPSKKGDVVNDDKASAKVKVTSVTKKAVEYMEPAGKIAKTISIPATVKINGVTYKVTKIDDNAFKNNKTVTKVTVGSNIKTIGKNAFSGATKLKTVKLGKNVTEVGANAFKGCSSLTSVTLGSKATKIGANAFSGCKKLKTIKITSTKLSSKMVAKNAFKGLTKATTIKVPKKKLSAYKKLFKQKGLSSKVKVKGY